MTAETRHAAVAVSIDALAQQWARQERAPSGSAYTVGSEIAARRRGGSHWSHHEDASAVAVIARPEHLDPGSTDLVWLAASLGTVVALDRLADRVHGCIWPDRVEGCGSVDVAVSADSALGPGSIDHAILVARVAPASDLGGNAAVSEALLTGLRCAVALLDDPTALVATYMDRCDTIGSRVSASMIPRGSVRGLATGLSSTGGLMITSPTGLVETIGVAMIADLTVLDVEKPR